MVTPKFTPSSPTDPSLVPQEQLAHWAIEVARNLGTGGGGGGHQSILYDATTDLASLVANNNAVTVQTGVDFTSHGKLSAPPDGFTFNGHTFPTWFDPTVTPEHWDTAGWFAFDFDGSDHLWVAQHWGFGANQGAMVKVSSTENVMDIFAQTGQTSSMFTLWDTSNRAQLSWTPLGTGVLGRADGLNAFPNANWTGSAFFADPQVPDLSSGWIFVDYTGAAGANTVGFGAGVGNTSAATGGYFLISPLAATVELWNGSQESFLVEATTTYTELDITTVSPTNAGHAPINVDSSFRVLNTGAVELLEQSDPAAAAATYCRVYAKDTGGVSRLYIRDDTAVRQLAVTRDITRNIQLLVSDPTAALATGDGQAYFFIPTNMNGYTLTAVQANVITVSTSGLPTVQIANVTQGWDTLTTKLTIDANEHDSSTAATAAVIDTASSHNVATTGDEFRIDVDVAGTGTKGLMVNLVFTPA